MQPPPQFVLIPKCILSILPPLKNPSWILACDSNRKLPAYFFNSVTQRAGNPNHLSLASSWTCQLSLPSAHLWTGILKRFGGSQGTDFWALNQLLCEHYFQAITLLQRTLLKLYLHTLRFTYTECTIWWFSVNLPFCSYHHNPIFHFHYLNTIPWTPLQSVPIPTLSLGQH